MKKHEIDITKEIIGAAIEVHRTLGPGFLENIYEKAMYLELESLGFSCKQQLCVPVYYRDCKIGDHRVDLLVEGTVIVELKAVRDLDRIFFATLRSYLKAASLETGLLFNFVAMPLEIHRVGREWSASKSTRHPFNNSDETIDDPPSF